MWGCISCISYVKFVSLLCVDSCHVYFAIFSTEIFFSLFHLDCLELESYSQEAGSISLTMSHRELHGFIRRPKPWGCGVSSSARTLLPGLRHPNHVVSRTRHTEHEKIKKFSGWLNSITFLNSIESSRGRITRK